MRRLLLATVLALTAVTAVAVTATAAPAAGGRVHFTSIHYNSGTHLTDNTDLNKEYVTIKNGGTHTVRMHGWTLLDKRTTTNKVFHFPRFKLRPGDTVKVHTGKGANDRHNLYWGLSGYTWDNQADTAFLKNKSGTLVDKCSYDSTVDPSPASC